MQSLFALCLALTCAFAVALPIQEPRFGGESSAKERRVFLVRVDAPAQQQQASEPATRQFPWPYPPTFESVLPEWAKQRLVEIYTDSSLRAQERADQINAVFDSLPQQVIEQLPMPIEYERLPFDVYKRLHYIHTAPGFKWAERQQLTQQIVEAQSDEVRRLLGAPRFGGPPPGFEYVLAPTVYKQLLFIHYNPALSREQRSEMITQVMRQVPADQIERLPLPSGMDRLPAELQKRLRALVYDYSVAQAVRAQRVRDFVQTLPEELRPALRR